ncbi:MAG TPA: carbohydrate ABC transporter permease [Ruminiclostridium sp.]
MNKKRGIIGKILNFLLTTVINVPVMLLTLFCMFPVVWMLYSSVKSEKEFALSIISFPKTFVIQNYTNAIKIGQMNICLSNSVKASILTVIIVLVLGFITGLIFGRYDFKFKKPLYIMFLSGMLIPVYSLLVPVFIEMKTLNLNDNIYAISLIYGACGLPLAIFLITSYVSAIPKEIEEAAIIDGASFNAIIFKIMMPICIPILGTVLILSFLNAWNEFPFALVLLGKNTKTIPIGLTYFTGMYSVKYTQLLAGLSIATLPVVIIYFVCYKKIIAGMVAGSVKG